MSDSRRSATVGRRCHTKIYHRRSQDAVEATVAIEMRSERTPIHRYSGLDELITVSFKNDKYIEKYIVFFDTGEPVPPG